MAYMPVGSSDEEPWLQLRRRELELREQELAVRRNGRMWTAVGAIATMAIPVAGLLGINLYRGQWR